MSHVNSNYRQWVEYHNWKWQLHPAGHVPGAAMIEIETPKHRILHSGDMDTRDGPNVNGAKPVECDILLLEATYSGKDHPNRVEEEARFVAKVVEVVERGGIAIVPAFASGRGKTSFEFSTVLVLISMFTMTEWAKPFHKSG